MSENSIDVTTIFNLDGDRSSFADRVMTLVNDMRVFKSEIEAGAQLVPQLTTVSLGEYIMLLEMLRWAIVKLAMTLDAITSEIHTEIVERTAVN
jgi:hypothetical protein